MNKLDKHVKKTKVVACTFISEDLKNSIKRSAEVNGRSIAGEMAFILRNHYDKNKGK